MNYRGSDTARIAVEFERRAREVPADFYSWNNPVNLMMHEQAVGACIRMLDRAELFPLDGRRIADIGCGDGTWLLEFLQWGADPVALHGVDLSAARVTRAHRRIPEADIRVGSAAELPWASASLDLVSQFTVFTSILDPALKRALADEMLRVLKPDGAILWFDFRVDNPSNSQVRGIRAAEICALFAECHVTLASTVLAPPIARRIARWSRPLAQMLHTLPFLRTHYAGIIHKRKIPCSNS